MMLYVETTFGFEFRMNENLKQLFDCQFILPPPVYPFLITFFVLFFWVIVNNDDANNNNNGGSMQRKHHHHIMNSHGNDSKNRHESSSNTTTTTNFTVRSKPHFISKRLSYINQCLNMIIAFLIYKCFIHVYIRLCVIALLMKNMSTTVIEEDSNDLESRVEQEYNVLEKSSFQDLLQKMIRSSPSSLSFASRTSKIQIMIFLLFCHTLLILLIKSWIMQFISTMKTTKCIQNICHVDILPWGIQIQQYTKEMQLPKLIEDSTRISSNDSMIKCIDKKRGYHGQTWTKERITNEMSSFIPLEDIVDVIVTEVILSYKVKNCIMFRLKKMHHDVVDDEDIALSPAFSTTLVELTYVECIQLWKGMSNSLMKYQLALK